MQQTAEKTPLHALLQHANILLLLLAAVLFAVALFSSPAKLTELQLLTGRIGTAIALPVLLAPLLIGALVAFFARRFWGFPYVYLVMLYAALLPSADTDVDAAFHYASMITLWLIITAAEIVGMPMGRLLHRGAGMAYFIAAGVWQIFYAMGRGGNADVTAAQAQVAITGAAVFLVQAGIQLIRWRKQTAEAAERADENDEDDNEAEPLAPPAATVNEGSGPWNVSTDKKDAQESEADADGEDHR